MLILFAIKNSLSDQNIIFLIIISLDVAYLLIVGLFYLFLRGNIFKLDNSKQKLSKRDKKRVNRFILIISFTILSGIFFGYMDVVILGYFVSSEYIGYYQGAFSFISAIVPLITFSSALLPIFSRLQKRKTQDFLKKAVKILSIISILCFLFLFLASKYLVLLLFGAAYYNSINILRIFSLLLLTIPVITIYSTYFTSSGRPGIVSMLLAISTTINLTLIYLFISYLIKYNPLYAVYGTAIATVISRYLFMFMLMIYKRKN
jgi:O-antigen/teichoic acid export membrane protein